MVSVAAGAPKLLSGVGRLGHVVCAPLVGFGPQQPGWRIAVGGRVWRVSPTLKSRMAGGS